MTRCAWWRRVDRVYWWLAALAAAMLTLAVCNG
jgi:hypothetical protein